MQGTGVDKVAVLFDDDRPGTAAAYGERGVGRYRLGTEALPG
jgi:hypothetical protein